MNKPESTLRPGQDLVLDSALATRADDRFDHEAIASVVADLAVNGPAPVNIALWGPWGSGKSSFLGLVTEGIAATRPNGTIRVARYDAWKYGGKALKKHFIKSVADSLGVEDEKFGAHLDRDHDKTELDLWKWVKREQKSLLVGLGLAAAVACLWLLFVGGLHLLVHIREYDHFRPRFGAAAKFAAEGIGPVIGLAFAAIVFGPKVLETAVVKVTNAAPDTDEEFAQRFRELVDDHLKDKGAERLVVFIDELDRCSPEDVVSTLVDLKTFLDHDDCVFIVAADRDVLEGALRKVPQATPVRAEDPYYSTPGAFLDKVFQHRIPLPPLRTQALTKFARELVEQQDGLWADLRAAQPDDRLFLKVIYTLIPAHVRSPRRAKVLLNNYATNVRIAEARDIDWLARADEIACLTVLETEFPNVAADLARIPLLLAYLRGDEEDPKSPDVLRVVKAYKHADPAADDKVPDEGQSAGRLLPSGTDGHDDPERQRANKVLNSQLIAYLRKVAAQDVQDPRTDLFYLQSAGSSVGITDPDLGYVLDLAGDLAPSDVVEKFAEFPSATAAAGLRVLVQQAENERGPSRTSLLESACRLAERLDPADLEDVARYAAGGVLAAVGQHDWPSEATPGAVLLGVMGENHALVESLLNSLTVEELTEAGTLDRFVPVLAVANPRQRALVQQLLTSAYATHPEALHAAINEAPLDAAEALYDRAGEAITDALTTLDATPGEAGERWAALLTAATSRNDEAGSLVSKILELGQTSASTSVHEKRVVLEDEAILLITDRARLNHHALLGLERADIDHADFWIQYLADGPADPARAAKAFERLVSAMTTAKGDTFATVRESAPRVIPFLAADYEGASDTIKAALKAINWPTTSPGGGVRKPLHALAHTLADHLIDPEPMEAVVVDDVINGLQAQPGSEHTQNLTVYLVNQFTEDERARLTAALRARASAPAEAVLTLRLLVAAAPYGTAPIAASELVGVADQESTQPLVEEWLALKPALDDVEAVIPSIRPSSDALQRYAKRLKDDDRTRLWIGLERNGWNTTYLHAVGQHGVSAAAVEHIATAIGSATQQKERDDLAARLARARLKDSAAQKSATGLIRTLLESTIQGNVSTAATVAIGAGGVPMNERVAIRTLFDAAIAAKHSVITETEKNLLRKIYLLTKPKEKSKGLRKIFGL